MQEGFLQYLQGAEELIGVVFLHILVDAVVAPGVAQGGLSGVGQRVEQFSALKMPAGLWLLQGWR